jgi:hypothetical protein
MQKSKFLIFLISVSLFLFCTVYAKDIVTDVNLFTKVAPQVETLNQGNLINLTFKSKIDNSYQPMLVKVPIGYVKAKSWPLLIVLHGLGDGPIVVPSIDSMIQIGPYGRGDIWYRGIGEQDVFESIGFAKQIFNIDPNKIYLCGFSMGGSGTFELGLKYPDIWAACVPVCGTITSLEMVANGGNLPFWINTGSKDKVVPAKYTKMAYEKAVELGFEQWKYTEYEGMGHSFWINWSEIEKWLLSKRRLQNPPRISFTSEKCARAYWAEIVKKINDTELARIDVETNFQTIKVKISNITNYTLYLKNAPVSLSQDITIIENEKQIFHGRISSDGIFKRNLAR